MEKKKKKEIFKDLMLLSLAQGLNDSKNSLIPLTNSLQIKLFGRLIVVYVLTRTEVYVGHNKHAVLKMEAASCEYLSNQNFLTFVVLQCKIVVICCLCC